LLDLIHEDLNRVTSKPYVEMSENMNRPDAVIAKEFWDGFKARNGSIIVDLMYGQLKSTVTCLTCGRISNAFDPYLSVCLPIVKEERLEFNFVREKSHEVIRTESGESSYNLNPMTVVDLAVRKNMRIKDVKSALIDTLSLGGVTPDDLVVANQKGGKITEIFKDAASLDDIDQEREYTMVFHVANKTPESHLVEFNFFQYCQKNKKSFTVDHLEKSAPRFFSLTNETTLLDVKKLIVEKMGGIFKSEPENDEMLNSMVEVHVRDNLPMVMMGKYTRTRAECEFCD